MYVIADRRGFACCHTQPSCVSAPAMIDIKPAAPMTIRPSVVCRTISHLMGFIVALISMSVITSARLLPPEPPPEPGILILHIGHLNPDCYSDTVIGSTEDQIHYLPLSIRWGQYDAIANNACDHTEKSKARRKADSTLFTYPAWKGMGGSAAFERINADSLDDIVLYMWGRIGTGAEERDTMASFIIFGQKKLGSVLTVGTASIDESKKDKFHSKRVRRGQELTHPAVRDISGKTSFILERLDMDVEDSTRGEILASGDVAWVEVYPNPAESSTTLVVDRLDPGDYTVSVTSMDGAEQLHHSVSIGQSTRLLQSLDLHALPSGRYLVQVRQHAKIVATYPIVVVR